MTLSLFVLILFWIIWMVAMLLAGTGFFKPADRKVVAGVFILMLVSASAFTWIYYLLMRLGLT
jgi:hypothetical protein